MKEGLLNFLFLFGLGVLAFLVLLLAGCFARGKVMVILAGMVATALMVLKCLLLNVVAGIGSAASEHQPAGLSDAQGHDFHFRAESGGLLSVGPHKG
jgi:hypothetical protein